MDELLLLLPPALNVVITAIFAGVISRQYLQRRRTSHFYWAIALWMAFIASLSYMLMLIDEPTSSAGVAFFRTYYILGGALMPAWLGLGSIALVSSPRVTRICLGILSLFSFVSLAFTLDAHINMQKLSQIAGTPGTGIIEPGPWLVTTIILNTLGASAIVGVAFYSGWKMLRRQSSTAGMRTSNLLWANLYITLGTILNAVAGSLARFLGVQSTFWLIMALGWIVFFVGIMLASRRSTKIAVVSKETITNVENKPHEKPLPSS